MEEADLALFILDLSEPLGAEDQAIATRLRERRALLLLNKVDLRRSFSAGEAAQALGVDPEDILEISAEFGQGLEDLKARLVGLVWDGKLERRDDVFLLNIREKDLLQRARDSLQETLGDAKGEASLDLLAAGLEEVLQILGELTGENLTEDLLERIFSDFCVGK